MDKDRDIQIDILRCIGLLLVILAHIPINDTIKAIRSFDVMLLIIIAGISFAKSGKISKNFSYKSYLIGRIKKLCIPTWITLVIIFSLAGFLCFVVQKQYIYSFKQIVESFLFVGGINGGIGNVWIVRIYMLMAIMSPIFIIINKRLNNDWQQLFLFLVLLAINEGVVYFFYVEGTVIGFFIENFVCSLICYSVGFLIGIKIAQDKKKEFIKKTLIIFIPILLFTQLVLIKLAVGLDPNGFKYPPQLYYAIYGIVASLFLFVFCKKINIRNIRVKESIIWLSKKSFDMYLAHTIVLKILSWGDIYIKKIFVFKISVLYYIFVLMSSVIMVVFKDFLIFKFKKLR